MVVNWLTELITPSLVPSLTLAVSGPVALPFSALSYGIESADLVLERRHLLIEIHQLTKYSDGLITGALQRWEATRVNRRRRCLPLGQSILKMLQTSRRTRSISDGKSDGRMSGGYDRRRYLMEPKTAAVRGQETRRRIRRPSRKLLMC
jgi:hypothetical protein